MPRTLRSPTSTTGMVKSGRTGEIDIATVAALRRHPLALPTCGTVVELSGASLLAAAGWPSWSTCITASHAHASAPGARRRPTTRPAGPRHHPAITRLDDTLLLTGTLDDAIHLVTTEIAPRPSLPRPASATPSWFAPRHPLRSHSLGAMAGPGSDSPTG